MLKSAWAALITMIMYAGIITTVSGSELHQYEAKITIKETDLSLHVDSVRVGGIPGFTNQSQERQDMVMRTLTKIAEECLDIAMIAQDVAIRVQAKEKTQEEFLQEFDAQIKGEDEKVSINVIHAGQRLIREAFRHGFRDPVKFGRNKMKQCIIDG